MTYDFKMVQEPDLSKFPTYHHILPGTMWLGLSTMEILRKVMAAAEVLDVVSPTNSWHFPIARNPKFLDIEDLYKKLGHRPHWVGVDEWDEFLTDFGLIDDFRRMRSPLPGKVLNRKFCSNEGWVVLPEECMLIAQALRKIVKRSEKDSDLTSYLLEIFGSSQIKKCIKSIENWEAYNFIASQCGGYEVW